MTKINKKADKSLDMIFSILILVIIAVVIITIALNAARNIPKSNDYVNDTLIKTFLSQQLSRCTSLCTSATQGDEDSVVQYCTQTFAITGSNKYSKAKSFGLLDYCPNHITCPMIIRLAPKYGISVPNQCRMKSSDCQKALYSLADKYPAVLTKYESLMQNAPYGNCGLNITNTNWMAVLLSNDINSAFTIKNTSTKPNPSLISQEFYDPSWLTAIGNSLIQSGPIGIDDYTTINVTYSNDKDSKLARETMAKYLSSTGSVYQIKNNLTG